MLAIEIPLGIALALAMPERGWRASLTLVLLAMPLLIPWNVVGTIWQIFARGDIGLLGHVLTQLGIDYNYTPEPDRRLGHRAGDGRVALDAAGRAARRTPRCARFPSRSTRPHASTARRAGRCFATSSCRRCAAC